MSAKSAKRRNINLPLKKLLSTASSLVKSLTPFLVKIAITNEKRKNATLGKNIAKRYIATKTPTMIRMPSSSDEVSFEPFTRIKMASVMANKIRAIKHPKCIF